MTHTYKLATSTWNGQEEAAIQSVISSGTYTMGERVKAFEADFAKWIGSKYAVMTNSGSSANLIAIASLFYRKHNPLKRGDEVIVPAVSWSTTYFPLQQYGLKLVFVDIDRETLNLDLNQLEAAITDKTRLIFTVNLLGNPCDFDQLQAICKKHPQVTLLEDNCESMGATFGNKMAGTFGLIGTHSSFFSHHIATMEGGICVTDDEELYQIMKCLRAHGWLRDLPDVNHVHNKTGDPFTDSFVFALPGYCLRPTEMQGAIGSVQIAKVDGFNTLRRKNAAAFAKRFHGTPGLTFQKETGSSSWFGFSMLVHDDAPFTRAELAATLRAHNIECRPIVTGDFTKNPVIAHIDHRIHGTLVNADYIHTHGIFVGNNPEDLTKSFDLLETALGSLGIAKAA
jgi:CDP-6-deoxy-D-xylo-4-hexulose-3-dehydrase